MEDIEDIARESSKLKPYGFQQDIADITQALQQNDFDNAITLINNFIKNNHALVIYNDIDIHALKLEIRQLEHQLNAYDNEKIELDKLFSEFYHRHTNELGSYIIRLLHLRKIFTKDDPEKYAEAVQNEEDYNEKIEAESEKTIYKLDDNQRLELKKAYRQASQICHPDRVNEEMKDIAQEVFIQLNQAYKQNDLAEVQRILSELNQGMFKPRSETVTEKDQLKIILQSLKYKIAKVEEEIITIKDSKDYQTISNLMDWNIYFEEVKAQLVEEIGYLENKFSDDNRTAEPILQDEIVPDQADAITSLLPKDESPSKPHNSQGSHDIGLEAFSAKESDYGVTESVKKGNISSYFNPNSQDRGKEYGLMVSASVTLALIIIMVVISSFI